MTEWPAVELREIRVFLTLAEELHFGRTAERLHVTPARVSQTVRAIESRVGGRLFDRTSRRVSLTPLGEQLRDTMTPAYAQVRSAWSAAQETAAGVAGVLRIGIYSMVNGGPHLVEIIRTFAARHPGCRVEVTDAGMTDQLALLRRNDVDLVAARPPLDAPGVVVGPVLSSEPRVLAVAVGHPLAGRRSIVYDDLAGYVVTDNSTFPRDLMDEFIPPRTPNGTLLRRADIRTSSEALQRVATAEIVHPTVRTILDHHGRPGITTVPISDLPTVAHRAGVARPARGPRDPRLRRRRPRRPAGSEASPEPST